MLGLKRLYRWKVSLPIPLIRGLLLRNRYRYIYLLSWPTSISFECFFTSSIARLQQLLISAIHIPLCRRFIDALCVLPYGLSGSPNWKCKTWRTLERLHLGPCNRSPPNPYSFWLRCVTSDPLIFFRRSSLLYSPAFSSSNRSLFCVHLISVTFSLRSVIEVSAFTLRKISAYVSSLIFAGISPSGLAFSFATGSYFQLQPPLFVAWSVLFCPQVLSHSSVCHTDFF